MTNIKEKHHTTSTGQLYKVIKQATEIYKYDVLPNLKRHAIKVDV